MIRTKKFENGLRLVVKPMSGLFSVSMGIIVGTGSAFETDEEDGLSHFIEHVQFKGTALRTSLQISDEFDAIGAQINAFTGKDTTCYYAKSTTEHYAKAFELLADLFLNSTFPEEELDKERGVVLEEIAMNEDTPEDLCMDTLYQAFYGNQNYGRTILGPASNVERFNRNDVLKYRESRYSPENTVISMAGDIDFEKACALTEKYFSAWKTSPFVQREKKIITNHVSVNKVKPIEQTHLALMLPSFERGHELSETLQLISLAFGGGMSSRLFQTVREELGLAYSVYSYTSSHEDCGNFAIYAGVNDKNADKAYEKILEEMRKLKSGGITDDEFTKGKEQMKASLMFAQESTSSQMLLYGKHILFEDKIFSFEDKLKNISGISKESVERCLLSCFNEDEMSVASVGKREKAFEI